jgi:hypothetical protein
VGVEKMAAMGDGVGKNLLKDVIVAGLRHASDSRDGLV